MDDFSKVQRGLGVARLCAERGRAEAGAWFPYLYLHGDVCLSDHCVNRPRANKSAGKSSKTGKATLCRLVWQQGNLRPTELVLQRTMTAWPASPSDRRTVIVVPHLEDLSE